MDPPSGSRVAQVPPLEPVREAGEREGHVMQQLTSGEARPWLRKRGTTHCAHISNYSSFPRSPLQDPRKHGGSVPSKICISPPHVSHVQEKRQIFHCIAFRIFTY